MVDLYVYYVQMPDNVNEYVTPCYDGYTVYINCKLPREAKYKAFHHALTHINNDDFCGTNINVIEAEAHGKD